MTGMEPNFDSKAYWERRLLENFNYVGVGDITFSERYNRALYQVRGHAFRSLLKTLGLAPPELSVLDIGSGTGFYVRNWLALGVGRLVGSDLTARACEKLSNEFPEQHFEQCDISLPLPMRLRTQKFDVVGAFDVLFHVVGEGRYEAALMNAASLVNEHGFLIFSDNLGTKRLAHAPHQVSRSEQEAAKALSAAGFELRAVRPMFVLMNDPIRTKSTILRRAYRLIVRFAANGGAIGNLLCALLVPLEIMLVRVWKRGPSTEFYVWQRVSSRRGATI